MDPSRPRPPQRRTGSNAGPKAPGPEAGATAEPSTEAWILEGVESEAAGAVRRGQEGTPRQRCAAVEVGCPKGRGAELRRGWSTGSADADKAPAGRFGTDVPPQRTARLEKRLKEATVAFRRERYNDALKLLQPLAREAPGVADVRELLGLTFYRMGRWKDARRELTKFATLSGTTEQHPVLADCARALGNYDEVQRYWDELREASPSADLVAEGRIVMAGALADQGRLDDAIRVIEAGRKQVKRPRERHLRIAYVLADLQERAGDLPTARSGFAWLYGQDPDFGDVADRLSSLQ